MFTWILIAIIVAALFGLINFDHIREWTIARSREAWPHIKAFLNRISEKIDSAKAHVENSKDSVNKTLDKANDKIEEYKEGAQDKIDN